MVRIDDIMCDDIRCEDLHLTSMGGMVDITCGNLPYDYLISVCVRLSDGLTI